MKKKIKQAIAETSLADTIKKIVLAKGNDTLVDQNSLFNPNDYSMDSGVSYAKYYKLDVSLLGDISLNYDTNGFIINKDSHTIYYLEGVSVNKEKYYAIPLEYKYQDMAVDNKVERVNIKDRVVYLAVGGNSKILRDYFECFNADNQIVVPKKIEYKITDSNDNSVSINNDYFILDNGVITSRNEFENSSNYYKIYITVINDENDRTQDVNTEDGNYYLEVHLTGVKIDTTINGNAIENSDEINIAKESNIVKPVSTQIVGDDAHTLKYTLDNKEKLSIYYTLSVHNRGPSYPPIDVEVLYGSDEWNGYPCSAEDILKIYANEPGSTKLNFYVYNGNTTKTITANVYDFSINDGSKDIEEKLEINSLNTSKTLRLKYEGPNIEFSSDSSIDTRVIWNVEDESIASVEYGRTDGTEINITSLKTGTTTLKGAIRIKGQEIATISVPINIT